MKMLKLLKKVYIAAFHHPENDENRVIAHHRKRGNYQNRQKKVDIIAFCYPRNDKKNMKIEL